jgi:peptidoglycan/LPS O-acetylase OafA/YrhL
MRRRIDAGAMVAAAGAVLLLVSLFLDWYGNGDDGVNAWTIFEVIDLFLAGIALIAIATFLRRSGVHPRLPDAPLLLLGTAALVLVFSQIVNHPPRLAALESELEPGAWLALAGAALLLAGAFMSVARVSFAVSVEHRERSPSAAPAPAPDPETETVKLTPPERPA